MSELTRSSNPWLSRALIIADTLSSNSGERGIPGYLGGGVTDWTGGGPVLGPGPVGGKSIERLDLQHNLMAVYALRTKYMKNRTIMIMMASLNLWNRCEWWWSVSP